MRPWSASRSIERRGVFADDYGSASLEFLAAGVLLLVPLVYLVITLAQVEAAAFASEGAARHAVRIIARDGGEGAAATAARSIDTTMRDFGIPADSVSTRVECAPDPSDCGVPGALVSTTITVDVPLPLVPPGLDIVLPLRVPVTATASAHVSDFAAAQVVR